MPVDAADRGQEIPAPALALGVGGLIPFWGTALMVWLGPVVEREADLILWGAVLRDYGAVILAFLGAVQWGLAMALGGRDGRGKAMSFTRLSLGIAPALVAWLALLMPVRAGLVLLMAGLVATFLVDRLAVQSGLAPHWYGRLRLGLTIMAVAALLVGALGIESTP